MFSKSAPYYDKIYHAKDYAAESARLREIIREKFGLGSGKMLDVACGTGRHIEYLKAYFEVQGLDISEQLLADARKRNLEVYFQTGDMMDFNLEEQFDLVICLFSAIGYVVTLENLHRAISCMAQHVRPGGGLVVEPWFTPETWYPGRVHALFIDEPELKLVRMNTSQVDGNVSIVDFHYLLGTPEGVVYFSEPHRLGLFTPEEMMHAFEQAGLEPSYDADGLTGRGLYLGRRLDEINPVV